MTQSQEPSDQSGKPRVSGVLLAGGESRRMGGVNKALLDLGGVRIIERIASVLQRVLPEVLLITNTPEIFRFLDLPTHRDIAPGYGALGGLYTGLRACSGCFAFLTACDMPFIKESILRYMVGLGDGYDVVAPRIHGRWEPTHAMYAKSCIPHIERLMKAKDLKITNFFDEIAILAVTERDLARFDPECRFLFNLNTPVDLELARKMVKSTSAGL
jgi:molybdopterin-guanine dinucleotide biosynthesis protein A